VSPFPPGRGKKKKEKLTPWSFYLTRILVKTKVTIKVRNSFKLATKEEKYNI
jgi:hypothetical protein